MSGSALTRSPATHPVACVAGKWLEARGDACWEHRNPSRWDEILGQVPVGTAAVVESAAVAASRAQGSWARTPHQTRVGILFAWADRLSRREHDLARVLATEIGKPVADGRAEVRRAVDLLHLAGRLFPGEPPWTSCAGNRVSVRRCPLGVVGLITPWNNPVAIPVGKLAPALLFGNGVVWKPAVQAPLAARILLETLLESGVPEGIANLVFGDSDTAQHVIARPEIAALSVTGSSKTGGEVAALCSRLLKPVQAELGGNNAAVVMADCDWEAVAGELAVAAFGFAGQRCTATRRLIVATAVYDAFEEALVEAVRRLKIGDPHDPATQVGPLVSRAQQEKIVRIVNQARQEGGHLLLGGAIPDQLTAGCWFQPTLIRPAGPGDSVVQEEGFGPVAVVQAARDLDEALNLCNGVRQGLIASLYTRDPAAQRCFIEKVQAGVVKFNQPTLDVNPEAPFGGWKASGLGPPEHGLSDREFYTRPQALYGWSSQSGN